MTGNFSSGEISISWIPNLENDIAGYLVYRSGTYDGQKEVISNGLLSNTSVVDRNIKLDTSYWYWVQAFDAEGLAWPIK